jgi:hypothetical protein
MAEWRDELSHMAIYNAEYLRELSKLSWDQALQGEWHGSLLDDMPKALFLLLSNTFFFQQLVPAWIETRIQLPWNAHPQNHNSRLPVLEKAAHLRCSISLPRCVLYQHFFGWPGPLIPDIWRLRLSCACCVRLSPLPRFGWLN